MNTMQTIYNCGLEMEFTCDKIWFALAAETDKNAREKFHHAVEVRHCRKCDKSVYLVDSPMALILGVEKGLCMAMDPENFADKPKEVPYIPHLEASHLPDLNKYIPLGVFIDPTKNRK